MNILTTVESLKCNNCPFYRDKRIYQCFLDITIKIDNKFTYPYNCPLVDGGTITVKKIDNKLRIGVCYD